MSDHTVRELEATIHVLRQQVRQQKDLLRELHDAENRLANLTAKTFVLIDNEKSARLQGVLSDPAVTVDGLEFISVGTKMVSVTFDVYDTSITMFLTPDAPLRFRLHDLEAGEEIGYVIRVFTDRASAEEARLMRERELARQVVPR